MSDVVGPRATEAQFQAAVTAQSGWTVDDLLAWLRERTTHLDICACPEHDTISVESERWAHSGPTLIAALEAAVRAVAEDNTAVTTPLESPDRPLDAVLPVGNPSGGTRMPQDRPAATERPEIEEEP